jgi:hypothetical protein
MIAFGMSLVGFRASSPRVDDASKPAKVLPDAQRIEQSGAEDPGRRRGRHRVERIRCLQCDRYVAAMEEAAAPG